MKWQYTMDHWVTNLEHIIKSRNSTKWDVSFISFVKILAKLIFPSTCWIVTKWDTSFSLMWFSLICIWCNPFVVDSFDHCSQAFLSFYMTVVPGIKMSFTSRKSIIWLNSSRNLMYSSVAYILASSELPAVTVCRLDNQWIGPSRST